MTEADVAVRNLTYHLFVELGRAPSVDEVAAAAGRTVSDVGDAWRRLHNEHALVLQEGGLEVRMANPFSGAATPYRVHAKGRWWFANCAWDAFGVGAALHVDARIETTCLDCDGAIDIAVHAGRPDDESLLFHCLVPAAKWWEDIVFT